MPRKNAVALEEYKSSYYARNRDKILARMRAKHNSDPAVIEKRRARAVAASQRAAKKPRVRMTQEQKATHKLEWLRNYREKNRAKLRANNERWRRRHGIGEKGIKIIDAPAGDAAWMAGVFDGGVGLCISMPRENHYVPTMTFARTRNPHIVYRLKSILGCGTISNGFEVDSLGIPRQRAVYALTGIDPCSWLTKLIMPYLTSHSQQKIIDFWGRFKTDETRSA
jgi:hypothetical protein